MTRASCSSQICGDQPKNTNVATTFEKDPQQMPKKKVVARSPWTKDDLRELKAHSKARTPVVKVAKAMKRTEAAVRQKAKTIGIGLGHRR